jgi:hypothetical protein
MKASIVTVALCSTAVALADKPMPVTLGFDADIVNKEPEGLEFARTGDGKRGRWLVLVAKDAPSGKNVLAQVDADDTDNRFPIAFTGPALKDFRLAVKCKQVSGRVDQGCGLVFRLKDADNYYVTRANALEDNVRLYHVVHGKRVEFANWNGKVKGGVWHELAVDVMGDHLVVSFDGNQVIDARDTTFGDAGKFGVWTKADSVTYFDDLVATPK